MIQGSFLSGSQHTAKRSADCQRPTTKAGTQKLETEGANSLAVEIPRVKVHDCSGS
jgi:hypothetical protein